MDLYLSRMDWYLGQMDSRLFQVHFLQMDSQLFWMDLHLVGMGLFLFQMDWNCVRQGLSYVHLLADKGFDDVRMGLCDVDVELIVGTGFCNVWTCLSDLLVDTDSVPEVACVDDVGFVIHNRNCN